MPRDMATLTIEEAQILYSNFSGKAATFNDEGDRNFCVLLEEKTALRLHEEGWNVKATKPREEGDEPRPYLQVTVAYKFKPPKIVLITSKGRTDIGEDMINMLDQLDIKYVDLIVRPFQWREEGHPRIAAYLKSIFVVLEEDELDLKWADVEYAQRPGDE